MIKKSLKVMLVSSLAALIVFSSVAVMANPDKPDIEPYSLPTKPIKL